MEIRQRDLELGFREVHFDRPWKVPSVVWKGGEERGIVVGRGEAVSAKSQITLFRRRVADRPCLVPDLPLNGYCKWSDEFSSDQ